MKRIDIIAGARPNFMKIAPIIEALKAAERRGGQLRYRLVHTGQHYDRAMSGSFFEELGIPEPDINLEPYNPGMLPGLARAVPNDQAPTPNNRFDRYDALFKNAAPPPRSPQPAETPSGPQAGQSLRERLLARTPGSTLLKR